ncbi:MAG: signal peptidase II, partial [Oscillospiraceae bacterium]|nr:signal peptidase II [Oscillospiraceae bacterium]
MFIAMLALIGLLCAADQFTKYLTVSHFAPYVSQYLETGVSPYIPASEQVAAIPGLFRFTFRANTGGGFSILSGHTWLLILITAKKQNPKERKQPNETHENPDQGKACR